MASERDEAADLPDIAEVGAFERRLTLRFDQPAINQAKNQAARAISRTMNVKGFRRGKAPRKIIENMVGTQRVHEEAVEVLVNQHLPSSLRAAQLVPAVQPIADQMRETEHGVEVEVLITLWPTLAESPVYQRREYEMKRVEVTEEMVDTNLERVLSQYAELETVERPSEAGDVVVIDLQAHQNGLPLENLAASDLLYEVGSGILLEGLDPQVSGVKAGDAKRFPAVLPGQMTGGSQEPVEVTVLVKEVRQKLLPGLNDEWVSDNTEYGSVQELRDGITEQLEELAQEQMRGSLRSLVMKELTAEMELEIPERLVQTQAQELMESHVKALSERNINLESYLQQRGQTPEQWQESILSQARDSLAAKILLDSVASHAEVEASDQEISRTYQVLSAQMEESAQDLATRLAGTMQENRLIADILRSKALDVLVDNAVVVDENGYPIALQSSPLTADQLIVAEQAIQEPELENDQTKEQSQNE